MMQIGANVMVQWCGYRIPDTKQQTHENRLSLQSHETQILNGSVQMMLRYTLDNIISRAAVYGTLLRVTVALRKLRQP